MNFKKLVMSAAITALFAVSTLAQAEAFSLSSPTIKDGVLGDAQVFNGFGCTGKNISPALQWKNAPKDTKSFALTVYDPDAPTGSGWWHWVLINIPANVMALPENAGVSDSKALPAGVQSVRTDFGSTAYGGACPPAGAKAHRYVFTLHALKTAKLEIPADATAALAGFMIYGNTIEKTTFTATFGR